MPPKAEVEILQEIATGVTAISASLALLVKEAQLANEIAKAQIESLRGIGDLVATMSSIDINNLATNTNILEIERSNSVHLQRINVATIEMARRAGWNG